MSANRNAGRPRTANPEALDRRRLLLSAAGLAGAALGGLPEEGAAGGWPAGVGQLGGKWEVEIHWKGLNVGRVTWTVNGDGTFFSSDGYSGNWLSSGGLILFVVYGGSRPAFAARLSGQGISSGIALQWDGSRGSWSAKPAQ